MKYIIVGCGLWGSELAKKLSGKGHRVSVLDSDPAALDKLGDKFAGDRVVGEGTSADALEKAGIRDADGLAAVTSNDEVNVLSAEAAGHIFKVPRVVARLHDPAKAHFYRRLGVHTVAPLDWGVMRMSELLLYSELDPVFTLGAGQVDIIEAEAPRQLAGKPVSSLSVPGEISVVSITRGARTFLPLPGSPIKERDLLHLAVATPHVDRVKRFLGLM